MIPYPLGSAPGQRFRFEQYLSYLRIAPFEYKLKSFYDSKTNGILYQKGHNFQKIVGVISGFLKRVLLLPSVLQYDYIFIFREAAPLGPPIFEWLIAKVFRRKIIYDFDDAIWLPNTSEENSWVARLKWHGKVASICRWSYKVSCGNQFLCDFAAQYNAQVVLMPTTIDTENLHHPGLAATKQEQTLGNLTIGWTGTHSTLPYLGQVVAVLQELEQSHQFTFLVIANKMPDLPLRSFRFIPWNKSTEIDDLLQFDIGLMPLTEDAWSKGKCGFKALQYMALEIPALVSPVGVNADIVAHEIDGFHCRTAQDWKKHLITLLENPVLRRQMGEKGRIKVEEKFSVKANCSRFLRLFS